jgi:hypothetical protein
MKRADFLRLMARLPEGRVMDLCAKIVMKCALVDGAGLAEADRYVVGNKCGLLALGHSRHDPAPELIANL